MYHKTRIAIALAAGLCLAVAAGAQERSTPMAPAFAGSVGLQVGAQNLDGNPELGRLPGVSASTVDTLLDLNVQGSVALPALRLEQRQDGVASVEGIGYEAGIKANLAQLYNFTPAASSYSMGSDSSGYSRIQVMIDWYEANKTRFGLPDNPFGAAGWPATDYGMSAGRYQFIKGTRVERADDVAWTSAKWADAYALYQDIKAKITIAIDQLYASLPLSTGDVDQYIWAGMSPEKQKLASLKQQAVKSFASAVSGSSASFAASGPLVSSAWVKLTNLGGAAEVRLDFAGQKLANGILLKSSLASQGATGAALAVGLDRRLVPGLSASLAVSCVGGTAQTPENWDTVALDYFPGIVPELGVQAKVGYSLYLASLNAELGVALEGLMPDLLSETLNIAAGGTLSWKMTGDLSVDTLFEGQFVSWADRLVLADTAAPSFAMANRTAVDFMGIGFNGGARFKDAGYSQRNKNKVEDRFEGLSALADFDAAALKPAFWWSAGLSFDPSALIGLSLVRLDAGVEQFIYGADFVPQGFGCNAALKFDFNDIAGLPVVLSGSASWYRNEKLPVYADMASLPARAITDDLSWVASLKVTPFTGLGLEIAYASKPFASKRQTIRDSSLLVTAKIKL